MRLTQAIALEEPFRSSKIAEFTDNQEHFGIRPHFPTGDKRQSFEAIHGRNQLSQKRILEIPREGRVFPASIAAFLLNKYGKESQKMWRDAEGKGLPPAKRTWLEEYEPDEFKVEKTMYKFVGDPVETPADEFEGTVVTQ